MFENRTLEMGAEQVFTQALVSELIRRTGVSLVREKEADVVVRGVVVSIVVDTLSRSSLDTAVERRVSAAVDLALIDPKTGEKVWSVSRQAESEEYTVVSADTTDEAARGKGIERIARRVAERLVTAMTDDF
jgi:hypothetical protein